MLPEAVAQYLETIPVAQRPIYDRLWQLIARHHPGAEVKLWYRMPTFKTDQGWALDAGFSGQTPQDQNRQGLSAVYRHQLDPRRGFNRIGASCVGRGQA